MISTMGREKRLYILAITVSVLVVYISALNAGYLPIDDGDMLQTVQSGRISILHLFLQGGKEYYRPLATLSLMGDFYLFGGKTTGYHIGNILLHLLNSLLVYRLAKLYFKEEQSADYYAFLAGLLFALHPVNTETVVWISCRPDLLSCFFSLLCLVMAFKVESGCSPVVYAGLFLFFFCSLLAKEASLLLPIAIALLLYQERMKVKIQQAVASVSALMLAALSYLLLRNGFSLGAIQPLGESLVQRKDSLLTAIDAFSAFGFYFRKLLYPFPLNLTITKIDSTFYAGFTIVLIASVIVLGKKIPALRFPLCLLAASLVPPIAAMLLLPIWTPYAERYLYLPSVAFTLCAVGILSYFGSRIPRFVIVSFVLALAIPTAFRVWLWTEPLLFWQRTVSQTSDFSVSRLVLASEYLKAGQLGKAEENLQFAIRLGLPRRSLGPSREIRRKLDKQREGVDGIPGLKDGAMSPAAASSVR